MASGVPNRAVKVVVTPGSGAGAARQVARRLVCIGGDATQSAGALAAIRGDAGFVPVPAGFGNIVARFFGDPNRAEAVLELLERGERRRVDVGAVGDELFLSHRSYGLLEQVQQV